MSRHLVDPQLVAALEMFAPLDMDLSRINETRALFEGMYPPVEAYARPSVSIEKIAVPGPDGAPDVPVTIYRPVQAEGPLPVFLHIHGGGYLFGSPAGSGPANVRTASELRCIVASVDYRLAPETRAPGAVEDCYAVLAWLNRHADRLGIDKMRIAVGGESAGGGLAAALTLLARDRGDYALCFQMLIYPMLDDRTCVRPDINPHVGQFVWRPEYNMFGWSCYLGVKPGSADVSPYAAAARATDLAGLPPAYLCVGSLDLFLEEDMDYAARLMAAGVTVEMQVYPGAYHAFEMAFESDVAVRAEADRRRALAAAFAS
ncbi:MAG: alpha/beta hydrolase [Sphingobium sp.]|nr:alpha/beta hydrolase [Sphingobium sp.]